MSRQPLVDLHAQWGEVAEDVEAAIRRVVQSQRFVLGPEVEAFEREVAAWLGVPHAIGVSSGTDALLASLMALGVGPGDEVITTPFTFLATAMVIARLGARAVFADIEPASFALDPSRVAATSRARAIVPVHLFGQMADVAALRPLGLPIVEDAAQAFGAACEGTPAGGAGTFGAFSFFPSKNLGAFGDAGLVTTADAALAERVRRLRAHGQGERYVAESIGGNFRLDALQAAVLRVKLSRVRRWNEARRLAAADYARLFAEAALPITPPSELPGRVHVFHQYVVRAERRDALRAFLDARGIDTAIYYPVPMHLQPCFSAWGYRPGDFPESERAAREALALPMYPGLDTSACERIVSAIAEFYAR